MTVPLSAAGLWLTGIERGLLLIGLAVAIGGLAGRGMARNYKGDIPAPLPQPWALRGSLLGVASSAALAVTALAGPTLAAELARPPVAGARAHGTIVFALVELACFAVAAVLLRRQRSDIAIQPLLGVVLAESLRSHPEGLLPLAGALLAICHLLPAVVWAGMLVYVLRAAAAWRSDPAAVRGLFRLYGGAAAWLVSVIIVTGVILALLLVRIDSLLTTTYGLILVAKAALVAVAVALAIAGRFWLRRAGPDAGPGRATRIEAIVLIAVLTVTGILTVISPPAKPVFAAQSRVAHGASRAGQPDRHNDHLWRSTGRLTS